ncbi:MAG: Gfo/Idh/MocA family oxidoreductase [Bryobacteraceae bacterium]|nr:Gfo/Idh/MocA family oxidoreductase [Bryobacteraceae bacterium]MDW8377457.1 Gfo/Idh/MocA family oxidoreductase [Bryobacterales bacterium]
MNRREFVLMASASAPAAFAGGATERARGANDRIRVAVIGVNGRGKNHIDGFEPLENVEVAALVDVDLAVANERAAAFEKRYGRRPAVVQDMRRVFDDKDIDVVSIATPNHWHALATIWACQAGKDVYVEKPATHSLAEGRSMMAAAKKYNRIVQHGVQLRSSEAIREAVDKLRQGVIGDVYMARATIFKWRPKLVNHPVENPPSTLDYNLWVGPAKFRPYSKNHVHYNWHWTWDYGNGEIGNQGVHELDMLQWGLGVKHPTRICAMGGKYLWNDHRETPELMTALCEFGREKKFAEIAVRFWCSNNETDEANGNLFYGSEGYMVISGYTKYQVFLGREGKPGPKGSAPTRHFENFIQAVRSRKPEELNGPLETAHYSCALAHLANAAFRVGGVLDFDPDKEQFLNNPKANALLVDTYRKGFEVPPPHKV